MPVMHKGNAMLVPYPRIMLCHPKASLQRSTRSIISAVLSILSVVIIIVISVFIIIVIIVFIITVYIYIHTYLYMGGTNASSVTLSRPTPFHQCAYHYDSSL